MSKKLTRDEWIAKAIARYGEGEYDYSLVEYVNNRTKVKIICLTCGDVFEQEPSSHVDSGRGCRRCGIKKAAIARSGSQANFIAKAIALYGEDKYDYSIVEYVNNHTKVKIVCLTCKCIFWQSPNNHVGGGSGCPECGRLKTADSLRLSPDEFVERAVARHPGEYDYSESVYTGMCNKVKIGCISCGNKFWQTPKDHIGRGAGCPRCGIASRAEKKRRTQEHFVESATARHPGEYDYSNSVYIHALAKVEILCLTCMKSFWQTPNSHISMGRGCPRCIESRGEQLVSTVLDSLAVEYECQKRFDACRSKRSLPFDFCLPVHNICIEYHGKQHYEAIDHFGGEKALKSLQRRDKIKAKFCKDNGIHLEVIPHWLDESQVRAIIARLAHVQLSLF